MFEYEMIRSFNELETLVYNYVMQNKSQVAYMTVRELAEAVHVSTSTVMRFCKKLGCDGYSEFRVKFKMYLKEEKNRLPQEELEELNHFLRKIENGDMEETVSEVVKLIKEARQVIFIGMGTSGILGKYGARYFSDLGIFSQYIEDPFYPIRRDMFVDTVVIALSVSGETKQLIELVARFKEHNCKIVSITNRGSCTLARMSDKSLSYYVTDRVIGDNYNITTQVPVIYMLETIGKRV